MLSQAACRGRCPGLLHRACRAGISCCSAPAAIPGGKVRAQSLRSCTMCSREEEQEAEGCPKPTEHRGLLLVTKMLHSVRAVCSRGLKSVIPAWRITAFKDYYDSFMHKQKKREEKQNPKAETTQIHRLCHSMGSAWTLNRRKSRTEIKQRHCKQQWTVISPWCLLQFSRQQVDYHSPELRQLLGPYEFSYWTGWIFSAGVSVHCRKLQASDTRPPTDYLEFQH